MKRLDFIRKSTAVIGTAVLGVEQSNLFSRQSQNMHGQPFQLDYAPHQGMFAATAGLDFINEIEYMYELGFRSIEDGGLAWRSVEEQIKIGETLAKLGMRMGVFVLPKGGNDANTLAAGKKEHIEVFLNGCRQSVEVAKRANAKWVTVVPGDFERNLPIGVQTSHVIEALKRGVEIFEPHGITMVLEPLSDTPDLFLRYTDQAYQICKSVGSPSCKILYDVYHQQRNEGNLITLLDMCWSEIAYIQVGDNPGRQEPTTGEINYRNVFKWLKNNGYDGVIGMEHGMFKTGVEGEKMLVNSYREVDAY